MKSPLIAIIQIPLVYGLMSCCRPSLSVSDKEGRRLQHLTLCELNYSNVLLAASGACRQSNLHRTQESRGQHGFHAEGHDSYSIVFPKSGSRNSPHGEQSSAHKSVQQNHVLHVNQPAPKRNEPAGSAHNLTWFTVGCPEHYAGERGYRIQCALF